jgi:hypothetical protein
MIMRWPYLKVLMFSAVYFVPKRRPRILTTFWTCVLARSGRGDGVAELADRIDGVEATRRRSEATSTAWRRHGIASTPSTHA